MSTIVFLHAHPDDESTQTSGSQSRASAAGDRVVVVYATNGDHGEVPEDLADGETLVDRRRAEAEASAQATGTARVAWLGYTDSGMAGWEQNADEGAFTLADLDEAAGRLAAVLDEEDADVVVGYDFHGNYGHPDHVKVHGVARRAADLAARRPRLLESTMNRDAMRQLHQRAVEAGMEDAADWDPDKPMHDGHAIGMPQDEIQWQVDVSGFLPQRRASLEAHASQATDTQGMLQIPEEAFVLMFGSEHFLEPGLEQPMTRGWPFEPLP